MEEDEVEFLKRLESQCNEYYHYYNKERIYYSRLANRFNIPILVTSAINALMAVVLNSFVPQKYVSILNAILSAGTGALGSIQMYLKINDKLTTASRTALVMRRLALKISKELSVDTKTSDEETFLSECFTEFNAALEQSNPVKRHVENFLKLQKPGSLEEPPSKTSSDLSDINYIDADSLQESPVSSNQSASEPEATPPLEQV